MKRIVWFGVVASALIALGFVLLRPENGVSSGSVPGAQLAGTSPSTKGDDRLSASRAAPTPKSKSPVGATAVFEASTLAEAFSALEVGDYPPGEKAYLRMHLAKLCTPTPQEETSLAQPGSPKDISDASLRQFTDAYCAGFTGSWWDEVASFDELESSEPVIEAYEFAEVAYGQSEGDHGRSAAVGHLEEVLRSPDGGIERLIAAQALAQLPFVSDDLATANRNEGWSLSTAELLTAQTLAVTMAMCDRYGGCGPMQTSTMLQCSLHAACTPTASASDVWHRIHSPKVLQAAAKLRTTGHYVTP